MSRSRFPIALTIAALAAIAVINFPSARGQAGMSHDQHAMMAMPNTAKPAVISLEKINSAYLTLVSTSIDKSLVAIQAGDSKAAAEQLHKAKMVLTAAQSALAKHFTPKFVNTRCPIMGSPIVPEKVADSLTRTYKGQKVAFCCGGCPPVWDKLTDAEKQAKLANAMPANQSMKSMNSMQGAHQHAQ